MNDLCYEIKKKGLFLMDKLLLSNELKEKMWVVKEKIMEDRKKFKDLINTYITVIMWQSLS